MKKSILTLIFTLACVHAFSQTNVFPPSGSVGIGTLNPYSYFHGGNNKVLEIFNENTSVHSQSHVVLSTGSTVDKSSAGTITWISRNSTGWQGMAYIAARLEDDGATNASGSLRFATANGVSVYERMIIDKNGNVGIGHPNPTEKLSVNGNIRAKEIKVENANWPDYVFAKDYALPSLKETEKHIQEKGHLPGIPSAQEVKSNGVDLGEMNAKLLLKIEELTLYMIELKKENNQQQTALKKQGELIKKILNKK
jgi:hypothetical protein